MHYTDVQVVLGEGVRYDTFKVPECPGCLLEDRWNSIVSLPRDKLTIGATDRHIQLKPDLVFFGESLRQL